MKPLQLTCVSLTCEICKFPLWAVIGFKLHKGTQIGACVGLNEQILQGSKPCAPEAFCLQCDSSLLRTGWLASSYTKHG